MNAQQRKSEGKTTRKTIGLSEKPKIVQLQAPSASEIQAAKDDVEQAATEATIRAVMPHIEAMRREGMTFMKIQRIFTQSGVDISLTDLRVTFDTLRAEAGATMGDASLPPDTP